METSDGDIKCDFTTTLPLDEHGFLSVRLSDGSVTNVILYPNAHITLLSQMTGLKSTASASILAIKHQIVIYDPSFGSADLFLLGGCLGKLHQFLLPF